MWNGRSQRSERRAAGIAWETIGGWSITSTSQCPQTGDRVRELGSKLKAFDAEGR